MIHTLEHLPPRQPAKILTIDWDALRPAEARRLRELGFDRGVSVEKLNRAPFGGDPLTVRVGRMTVAIRRAHAAAVSVEHATA